MVDVLASLCFPLHTEPLAQAREVLPLQWALGTVLAPGGLHSPHQQLEPLTAYVGSSSI